MPHTPIFLFSYYVHYVLLYSTVVSLDILFGSLPRRPVACSRASLLALSHVLALLCHVSLLPPSAPSCPSWAPQLVQCDPSQRGSTLLDERKWSPMPWRPTLPPSCCSLPGATVQALLSRCRRHRRCCCSHLSITSSHLTLLSPPTLNLNFVYRNHCSPNLPFKDSPPSSPFPPLFILGANVMESQRCMTAGLWANAPAGDIVGLSWTNFTPFLVSLSYELSSLVDHSLLSHTA